MRVLFIYPSLDCPAGVSHGVAALAGVLEAAGHRTSLIHACEAVGPVPDHEEIARTVEAFEPQLIAHSVMSQQYAWSCAVAEMLRERFDIPQVMGGVHATMVPETVCEDGHFEFVCVGEGEAALLELVERLESGGDLTSVPNMRIPARHSPSGERIDNPVGPFPDLASLPPKHFELFDLERICEVKNGWFGMLTSRGCPYKCTYCFNQEIVDRYRAEGGAQRPKEYLRHYPVERIIGEIRELKARIPRMETLIFDDDLFTLNRQYVHEFTQAYRESGIGLPYVVNAHVQRFDDTMAKALADSGCFILKFGVESGSERLRRDVLWRYMSNQSIEDSFAIAHRHGLHTSAFLMFGLPRETREDIMETVRLCAKVKMGRFRWAIFFPFPGTAGHRIAEEEGLIDYEKMGTLGNYFDGSCLRFGPEQDLLVEKMGKVFHWYVNAESDSPCAPIYARLVEEVERWDRATFEARKDLLPVRDRQLSERLLQERVPHYSRRYSSVMAVHSDFILEERERAAKSPSYRPLAYTLD